MTQQQQQPSEQTMTPRESAKAVMRPYVLRGDTITSICYGSMGWAGTYGRGQIQGRFIYIYDDDWKAIGKYKVAELYAEIKAEAAQQVTQASLFDGEATP